jgi:hypothetical protein
MTKSRKKNTPKPVKKSACFLSITTILLSCFFLINCITFNLYNVLAYPYQIMNKEITSLVNTLRDTLSGQPWFGRSITELLLEISGKKVYQHPQQKDHSLLELLNHMITWANFTLNRIERKRGRSYSNRKNRLANNKPRHTHLGKWSTRISFFTYYINGVAASKG